jgi:Zn-dependent peptidase ImmA (M78 family)
MNDRGTITTARTVVQASAKGKETLAARRGRAKHSVRSLAQSAGARADEISSTDQADRRGTSARHTAGADRPNHARPSLKAATTDSDLFPSQVPAYNRGDSTDRGSVRSSTSRTRRPNRGTTRLMPKPVYRERPRSVHLVKYLRDLTPPWAISQRRARQITERQARLLLADANVTAPPVPTEIVSRLDGIYVYPLREVPIKGLVSASKPTAKGGDIIIDANLPMVEQRVAQLHELKHIIDGGHATQLHQRGRSSGGEQLCADFALSVLMPAGWLRADWNNGHREAAALAEHYQVPVDAVRQRLHALGLVRRRPKLDRAMCQWHTGGNEMTRRSQ